MKNEYDFGGYKTVEYICIGCKFMFSLEVHKDDKTQNRFCPKCRSLIKPMSDSFSTENEFLHYASNCPNADICLSYGTYNPHTCESLIFSTKCLKALFQQTATLYDRIDKIEKTLNPLTQPKPGHTDAHGEK